MNKRSFNILVDFTRRELFAPYRNSWLDGAWVVLNPLILIGIYTLVFSRFMGIRFGPEGTHMDYSVSLAARLAVFTFFAQTLSESPTIISSQPYFVKKIVFPLPVLVVSRTIVEIIPALIILGIAAAVHVSRGGAISAGNLLYASVALAVSGIFCLGMAFFVSSLGVYLPDLRPVLSHLARVLIFISPVFYPLSMVPENIRPWADLNPASWMVELVCKTLIEDGSPDRFALLGCCLTALAVLGAGWAMFRKLRPGFSDVL